MSIVRQVKFLAGTLGAIPPAVSALNTWHEFFPIFPPLRTLALLLSVLASGGMLGFLLLGWNSARLAEPEFPLSARRSMLLWLMAALLAIAGYFLFTMSYTEGGMLGAAATLTLYVAVFVAMTSALAHAGAALASRRFQRQVSVRPEQAG